MGQDCIFCKIAAGEIPSTEVYSDEEFYAFRDIDPKAPSHVLIIPRRHVEKLTDARSGDEALLGRLLLVANRVADKEGIAEGGFRCVLNCGPEAGQEVMHIHLHVLGGRAMTWPPG